MTKFLKYIFSIVLIFIFVFTYYTSNKNNISISVFNQKDSVDNTYAYYEVIFENGLNSKNINKYFKTLNKNEYKINTIYPKINGNWNNDLKENLNTIDYTNLEKITEYYINHLEKYNLYEDINSVKVYGFTIDKVIIYTSYSNIKILSDSNIKIKKL